MSKDTPQQRLDKKLKEAQAKTRQWALGVNWESVEKVKHLCKTGNEGVFKIK